MNQPAPDRYPVSRALRTPCGSLVRRDDMPEVFESLIYKAFPGEFGHVDQHGQFMTKEEVKAHISILREMTESERFERLRQIKAAEGKQ